MPRNVRNFWLDGQIDGRSSDISGGPQRRDGGYNVHIYQREDGGVARGIDVGGRVMSDGRIVHVAYVDGAEIRVETFRDRPGRRVTVTAGSQTFSVMNTLDEEVSA